VLADPPDGTLCGRTSRIEPEDPQELEGVERVGKVLRERPVAPVAVGALLREQLLTPALRRDLRAFVSDSLGWRARQISHDLPPDRGIRIQQPVHDAHPTHLANRRHSDATESGR
jgi:hypothetical protein